MSSSENQVQGGDVAEPEAQPEAQPEVHPLVQELENLHKTIVEITALLKSTESQFKNIKKQVKKLSKKKRKSNANGSGNLVKPIPLSDALCGMIGQDPGSSLTRGQVTSAINEYAKSKEIKKPGNGRIILVDQGLGDLLGLNVGTELQIFHVQKYLKEQGHYLTPVSSDT
ncbi:SWIB/MDM2 domain-containing protein [Tetraselmis virus 1]|uniref:SWIB/MDM2 domain-containing protein n=1 Tax=Tetraselmis virus 1 TaxID=2060617 RepID=A0A2P0VN21_9VIRU|nr:SWIB/MDM2 domain-containing protein [Tetraselmis virus 1]AUF82296.1 SWIB/MDM2 domain-containing protein [Tetraselmis virus 1]